MVALVLKKNWLMEKPFDKLDLLNILENLMQKQIRNRLYWRLIHLN